MSAGRRWLALVAVTVAVPVAIVAEEAAALWSTSAPVGANAFATDTLDPPAALVAVGGLVVTLTWTPTLDLYATGYRISRATASGGPYTPIANVTPVTAALHIDNPPGVGTFYYVVESVSGGWTSARSNVASAFAL